MIKYLKFLIILFYIFNFNYNAKALSGLGPIKFNDYTLNQFFKYLKGYGSASEVGKKKGTPLSFAINPEGTTSFFYYCPLKFGSDCNAADAQAVRECTKISIKNGGSRCKLFARGYRIVWGGTNIKLSRKFDEQVVHAVFTENGWLEDFSNRPPPSGTGENKYIQKKKNKNKSKIVKKEKSKNIVSELQELKKLLEDGVLSEEEFKDAKKKLLD